MQHQSIEEYRKYLYNEIGGLEKRFWYYQTGITAVDMLPRTTEHIISTI